MSFAHSPVFVKAYDLIAWLLPQTQSFPKSQRFVLAKRVEDAALDLQEALIAAGKTHRAERRRHLLQADIRLEQLRIHWRLCRTLNLVEPGRYEHGVRLMDEVGRLLGGWISSAD
jgi:23S rRNA-intervening sequence protein